jgi:cobalt/nickel transport system permease protein
MTRWVSLPKFPSPLTRLDARWKLAACLVAVGAVSCLRDLTVLSMALATSLGVAIAARLPVNWLLRRMAGLALILMLFSIWTPFIYPANATTIEVGPITMSKQGLESAARLCLKSLAIAMFVLTTLTTTPSPAGLHALHRLGVPSRIIHLTSLTLRYMSVLASELGRIALALRVRGYRNRPRMHSYRTIGNVSGTLLNRGLERAERVHQAMRLRGFAGRYRSLTEFRTRPRDVVTFAATVAWAAIMLLWDRAAT